MLPVHTMSRPSDSLRAATSSVTDPDRITEFSQAGSVRVPLTTYFVTWLR